MRLPLKKVGVVYFASWWLPFVFAFCSLLLLVVIGLVALASPYSKPLKSLAVCQFVLLILTLLGIVVAAIWNLVRKRWSRGLINLFVMFPLSVAATLDAIVFLSVAAFLGPSDDGFGQDINIPPEMILNESGGVRDNWPDRLAEDPDGNELIGIFSKRESWPSEPVIDTNFPELDLFVSEKRALLMRHLATSARWCLRQERGKTYAFRRFVTDLNRWETSLNGNYTDFDWRGFGRGRVSFQVKIIIGVDEQVIRRTPIIKPIVMDTGAGEVALMPKDAPAWPGNESHLVLRSGGPTVEILEIAETMQRPFTMLALSQIRAELNALLSSNVAKQKGYDSSLIPSHSVHRGKPDIWLQDGIQGGIYLVDAYVNPGESGYAYLKVFEATKNTRLSQRGITQDSAEYVGWSDDPVELFFYHTLIMVNEGTWGVYYPARFELWFVPDSGAPELKLIEKLFKIEGWRM